MNSPILFHSENKIGLMLSSVKEVFVPYAVAFLKNLFTRVKTLQNGFDPTVY